VNAAPTESLDRLTQDCLAHCREEIALLRETQEIAAALDGALERGDTDEWRSLLTQSQTLPSKLESVRPRRTQMRIRLQLTLGGSPQDASLRKLAERTADPLRQALLQAREELAGGWESLLRLQKRQTAFVRICGDFMQRLLAEVVGSTPVGPRYGPSGRPVAATIGTVFAAKG